MADLRCRLDIKAIPNAPKSALAGWTGEALKVRVHAPATEGRANEELCVFLAEALGVPRRAVTVVRGETSRLKLVEIAGLTSEQVRARVAADESR